MSTTSDPGQKPLRCPICGKPAVAAYRPFCSRRCADIDLAKWFGGAYAVPGREEDEGDGGGPRGRDEGSGTDEG